MASKTSFYPSGVVFYAALRRCGLQSSCVNEDFRYVHGRKDSVRVLISDAMIADIFTFFIIGINFSDRGLYS